MGCDLSGIKFHLHVNEIWFWFTMYQQCISCTGMARRNLSSLCKWAWIHNIQWHCQIHRVPAHKSESQGVCNLIFFTFSSGNLNFNYSLLSFDITPASLIDSYLKWRMLAWECGSSSSTVRKRFSTLIIGSSVNMGAWKTITLHIINHQDKWSVCGIIWVRVELVAAIFNRMEFRSEDE